MKQWRVQCHRSQKVLGNGIPGSSIRTKYDATEHSDISRLYCAASVFQMLLDLSPDAVSQAISMKVSKEHHLCIFSACEEKHLHSTACRRSPHIVYYSGTKPTNGLSKPLSC